MILPQGIVTFAAIGRDRSRLDRDNGSNMVDTMQRDPKVEISLLVIRLATAAFLFVWAADKFVNPQHGQAVLGAFYGMKGVSSQIVLGLGIAQLLLVVAFTAGWQRFWTYGAALVMHGVTTIVSVWKLIPPFGPSANILFWAGVPVLAGLFALFVLRDRDRILSIDR